MDLPGKRPKRGAGGMNGTNGSNGGKRGGHDRELLIVTPVPFY
jgi:hypothetical protein